eukprot:2155345-Lingulodinium_polyedra.AAC.1
MVETLLDLGLIWSEGQLWVNSSFEKDLELFEKLTLCIMGVMRFPKFTDSRWLSVGTSARTMVASMLLGLDSLVAFCRKDPATSDYYIG